MWSETKLSDVCSLIADCPHNTAPESEDVYAYAVGTKAIAGGRIDFDRARPVALATYERWIARATPSKGDLILCREAPVGPVAPVPESPPVCLGQRTVLLRPDPAVADHRFVLHVLLAPTTQAALHVLSEGSTVAHLNVSDIRDFPIPLPPIDEQERIAAVLGALDDKIDSNRRLAELLEETAAVLFKARFVDFVGVEEFVDSEIGSIPVGWRVDKLATLVEHHVRRCKPSTETAALPYVPIDVIQPHSLALREPKPGAEAQSSLTRFDAGDILFGAMRPYFHKVAIAPYAGTTRTTVFVLKPVTPQDWSYVVMLMHQTDTVEFATRTSRGSTIPYAVWDGALGDMQIPVPAPELRKECGVAIEPILRAIQESSFEQRSLAEIRDLLLPRLISGQIRVPDTVDVDEVIGPLVEAAP